jgi:hypothetical protein
LATEERLVGGIVAGVEEDEADALDDLGVFWYGGGCLIRLLLIAIVVSYGRITHQQHLKRGNNKGVRTTTTEHIKIIAYHCQQQSISTKQQYRSNSSILFDFSTSFKICELF